MYHSTNRTSGALPSRPPKPSLNAQRVLGILLELGHSEAEALERISGDATLCRQLAKDRPQR